MHSTKHPKMYYYGCSYSTIFWKYTGIHSSTYQMLLTLQSLVLYILRHTNSLYRLDDTVIVNNQGLKPQQHWVQNKTKTELMARVFSSNSV